MAEHPLPKPFAKNRGYSNSQHKTAQTVITTDDPEFKGALDRLGRFILKRVHDKSEKKKRERANGATAVDTKPITSNNPDPGEKQSVREECDIFLEAVFKRVLQ